jgi:hypothetical protein
MGMLLKFYELIPFRRSISSCPAGGKVAPPVNAVVKLRVLLALAIHTGRKNYCRLDFRLRYFEASKHRVIADDMIFHIVD